MVRIAGCAGHALSTRGKESPDGEKEWGFNDTVIDAFEKELLTYKGVEFLRTDDRTGKRDVPLEERTDKANAWGADLYISFHHNGYKGYWSDDWTGTETYTYGSGEGLEIGKKIQAALVSAYGLKDRGMKKANLHIIRETKMPAVLTEGGYMDSTIDIKKLRDKKVLADAGKKVAIVVAKHYKLAKKPVSKPKPAPKPSTSKTYKVVAGDTFWSIARKHKLTVQQLQTWNPDVDATALPIGKVLNLAPTKKYVSLVNYLEDHNQPFDFVSRSKLAAKHGISNYSGTAEQNLKLLEILQK